MHANWAVVRSGIALAKAHERVKDLEGQLVELASLHDTKLVMKHLRSTHEGSLIKAWIQTLDSGKSGQCGKQQSAQQPAEPVCSRRQEESGCGERELRVR